MADQYNQIKLTFTTNNLNITKHTLHEFFKMAKNCTNLSSTNFANKKPKTVILSKIKVHFDISSSMWCAEKKPCRKLCVKCQNRTQKIRKYSATTKKSSTLD